MNVSTTHDDTNAPGNIVMDLLVNGVVTQTQTLIVVEEGHQDGTNYCYPSCNMVALVYLNADDYVNGRITWTGSDSVWRTQTVYFSILQTSVV
jgi:hypothetical protein